MGVANLFSNVKRSRHVETFSVSVDARTKAILKAHADRLFAGNMSALIAAFGREAEKRDAVHAVLEGHFRGVRILGV